MKFESIKIQIEDFRNKFNLKKFNKKNYFCLDDESKALETLEQIWIKFVLKKNFQYQGRI